jgi:thiamine pyrophosphokinase
MSAVDDFSYDHPFLSYFVNYSWEHVCEKFKSQFQKEGESNDLRLACFIIHAAKISLVTDMACSGEKWDKILKEAEKSQDLFVRISITLYRLCNFMDNGSESERLKEQLKRFKKENFDLYKLIGFSS